VSDLAVCEIVSKELLARLPAIRDFLRAVGPVEGELSTLENREGTIVLGELRLGSGAGRGISSKMTRGSFDGFRLLDAEGGVLSEDGPTALTLTAGNASFEVSVSSFFQGNRYLLDAFLEEIRTTLRSVLRVEEERRRALDALDLYAGVGFLTRPLLEITARSSGRVVAVEVEASSSRDLSENLGRWESEGLPAERCVHGTAEAFLSSDSTWKRAGDVDIVVADPPRAGLSPIVRQGILRLLPRALLLVSCDPPTLARDLGALGGAYRLSRLTLLDLFPGTHHVESVALLLRRDEGPSVVR
jgi:tRNA/tmRNA/rRNA uracil-C5-methylase (TrmA/RlmC/RlmD family)